MQPGSAPSAGAKRPGRRRLAREFALQILYQCDAGGVPLEASIAALWESQGAPPPDVRAFAEDLARGTERHREGIDASIAGASEHWDPSRMAAIDRTILRLAVFELLHREDIPPRVSMNEYIEIAKKFSTEDSGAFVNGIVDRIWREQGGDSSGGRASREQGGDSSGGRASREQGGDSSGGRVGDHPSGAQGSGGGGRDA